MWTVPRIIGLWPSAEHFSADIGLKYPSYGRVMKMRGRIPHRYHDAVLSAAKQRGYDLSAEAIALAHGDDPPCSRNAAASSQATGAAA